MIKNAITPALIKQAIDSVWSVYDADGNGVLDMEEARTFVEHVLS
jgi:Ca2+-binding EF-hand superfamily protein